MFVTKKKLQETVDYLKLEIAQMKLMSIMVTYDGEMHGVFGTPWSHYGKRETSHTMVLRLLLEHLGLEIVETPGTPSSTTLEAFEVHDE